MQSVSNTYSTIFADAGHRVQWRVTVNGTAYGEDKLVFSAGGDSRPKLARALISGNEPEIGKCIAATFSCAILEASANIPRMAAVVPAIRLVLGNQQSEWITLGTFYIDTRQTDKLTGALKISCYDRMLVADGTGGKTYADLTGFSTWPQPMSAVASECAAIMGISIDARTTVSSTLMVEYPNDYTIREVLGYIAVAHGGNWTITPGNKLRLVPITGNTDSLTVGVNGTKLETAPALAAWTGVTLYWDDENAYTAGTDTGRVLTCECPWATQTMANGILQVISGAAYQPYTMPGAILNLAMELGDRLTLGSSGDTVTGPVMEITVTAGALEQADIAAPGEAEIDHEYPYASAVDRSMRRKVALGKSYFGNTITREHGFRSELTSGAYAQMNASMLEFVDENGQRCLYYDPAAQTFIINGTLGSNAVFTDSLYAEQGAVSELTVDRLSTSRRIRMYLLHDTTDDLFIRIQDRYMQWVAATPSAGSGEDNGVLLTEAGDELITESDDTIIAEISVVTEQAANRYGDLLWWQQDISDATISADGYPYVDGEQVFTTTQNTGYPVMVYRYDELVKLQVAFESDGTDYTPIVTLGAGDENGHSKAVLSKTRNGVAMVYDRSGGSGKIGFEITNAGEIRKISGSNTDWQLMGYRVYEDLSVSAGAWTADSRYSSYPYRADISCDDVTAGMLAELVVNPDDGSGIAAIARCGTGTVSIYAAAIPAGTTRIERIGVRW